MTYSLTPFTQLIRRGMPEFMVCRQPLLLSGDELQVGDVLPATAMVNRTRVRQMYEQRRIMPIALTQAAAPLPVVAHRQSVLVTKQPVATARPTEVTALPLDVPPAPALSVTPSSAATAVATYKAKFRKPGAR